jgi:NAD dependent epimerase/dehydratase family enzyme
MSWIAVDDAAALIHYALEKDSLEGPVNAVAPQPVQNREFSKTLAGVLHRPAFFPVPSFVLRLIYGEMADALLLSSQRVWPQKLLDSGFSFRHPRLEEALKHLLHEPA